MATTAKSTQPTIKPIRDFGTPEIARRFAVVPKLTSPTTMTNKVVDETAIDRLLLSDDISASDYSVLMALLARLRRGSFGSLQSPDLDGVIQAREPSRTADNKAAAIFAVVHLVRAMDSKMGAPQRKALVNLVLVEAPWPFPIDLLRDCVRHLGLIFSRH